MTFLLVSYEFTIVKYPLPGVLLIRRKFRMVYVLLMSMLWLEELCVTTLVGFSIVLQGKSKSVPPVYVTISLGKIVFFSQQQRQVANGTRYTASLNVLNYKYK